MNEIGNRLRKARDAKKLSQSAFGKAIGVSQNLISALEKGSRKFNERLFLLLKTNHLINPDWLMTGDGEMFVKESAIAQNKDNGMYYPVPVISFVNLNSNTDVLINIDDVSYVSVPTKAVEGNEETMIAMYVEESLLTNDYSENDFILVNTKDKSLQRGYDYVIKLEKEPLIVTVQGLEEGGKVLNHYAGNIRNIEDVETIGIITHHFNKKRPKGL